VLRAYFAGGHVVPVVGEDPIVIPAAPAAVIDAAIASAVEAGRLRYRHESVCVQAEPIPAGLLADDGELMMPFPAPSPAALLPQNLPQAWTDGIASAHSLFVALATQAANVLPWVPIRHAIDDAFRLGLLRLEGGVWPVDLGMAESVRFSDSQMVQESIPETTATTRRPTLGGGMRLKASEVVDLADQIPTLMKVGNGLDLEFVVEIRIPESAEPSPAILASINEELAKVKEGWRIG
jgi:hypothetical protein